MFHFLLIHWHVLSTSIGAVIFIRFFYSLAAEVWEDMGRPDREE